MRTIVAVGIAGALGALARYGIGGLIVGRSARAFPWETFAVNVSGSFVLGFAFTLMTEQLTTGPCVARHFSSELEAVSATSLDRTDANL